MIKILALLAVGALIGMIITIIIFRKGIIQLIDYPEGSSAPEASAATSAEKKARLKNLRWHLAHVEKADYPGEYQQAKREVIAALKAQIGFLESADLN